MTKVSVFGEQPTEQPKELKKIEFVKWLGSYLKFGHSIYTTNDFKNIMLFEKNFGESGYDIIFAWNDISDKHIFLGHWNDGVV